MNLVEGRIRKKSHISISLNADFSVIWLLLRGKFSQTKFKEVTMREIFAGIVRDRAGWRARVKRTWTRGH